MSQGFNFGIFICCHEAVICLLDGLEFELGFLLVVGMLVWVPLLGQLSVRLFGLSLRSTCALQSNC